MTGNRASRPLMAAMLLFCLIAAPAAHPASAAEPPADPGNVRRDLKLGSTHSMADSGLAAFLTQAYQAATGVTVRWQAQAQPDLMHAGAECAVDAFFSTIPELEFTFMQNKYGEQWLTTMYSNFILVGPKGNPAKVPSRTLLESLHFIAVNKVPFASSRDGTGNREAENYIWNVLKMPEVALESWYITAPPQAHTLLPLAEEKKAYAFVDAWAWMRYRDSFQDKGRIPLEAIILYGPMALKQYSIIAVSREHCPNANAEGARSFADWLLSPAGQRTVGSFRYQNVQLFHPLNTPE